MRLISLLVILILAGSSVPAAAQDPGNVPSDLDSRVSKTWDYTSLVNDLFSPITASLNLTREQEFQMIAIVSGSQVMAEPLMQRFYEVEQQMIEATFAESFDESRVRQLSEQEAKLLSQLISLRIFARAKLLQVLTPKQRMLVSQQFSNRRQTEGRLGVKTP